MSNASNLSTLANVLDDGTSGQFLKSTGSGGVAFDTVAAGATVYSSASDLPLTGNTVGDMAYVSAATTAKVVNQATGSVSTEDATRLYIYSGTGWYSVAFITQNPTISTVQDAGGDSTPFTLATDGTTATVVTITANDPESVPLTYSYSVTSGSLNGSTVAQGTGSNTNVFTVTPHASQDATFTLTFTASDGINQATSANAFSLSFITTVTDSKYTTMLATATGTSDNDNITDSSSNSHSITVNGDSTAGTFSPYRSGGYAINFGSSASLKFAEGSTSDFNMGTNAFTIEMWVRPINTSSGSRRFYQNRISSMGNGKGSIFQNGSNLYATYRGDNGTDYELTASGVLTADTWTHVCFLRNTSDNTLKLYYNGTLGQSVSVPSTVGIYNSNSNTQVGLGDFGDIANLRVVNGTAITPTSSSILEKPTNVTNTVLLMIGGNFVDYSGNAPQINNYYGPPQIKAYGPLDYTEYSTTDHGGSVYFDTSDDYLTVPNGSWKTYGSNNFTIECWFYTDRDGMLWGDSSTSGFGDNCTVIADLKNFSDANAWVQVEFRVGSTKYGINPAQGTFKRNAWNHIAFVRNGNTFTVYSDGKDVGNTSQSGSMNTSSNDWAIASGWPSSTGTQFNGYISDFRVSKSARYTAEFTPPTAPLSSTGAELHLKGTDASIIDKSQSTNLKLIGTTTGSTDQVRTGNWTNTKTIKFDGNSDYITIANDEAYGFGTGDWTIETWLYCTKTGGFNAIFDTRVGTGTQTGSFGMGMYTTGKVQLYASGFHYYPQGGSDTLSFNTWQHLAVVKNSGTTTMYFNGTAASTTYSDSRDYGSSQPVQIGKDDTTSNYFGGYIQDFRISKGKARYTGNFTPPSAPLEG